MPVDVDVLLAMVREIGSGSDYRRAEAGGRSGAYLYSADAWRGYAGYVEPRLAPAAVQDARARVDAQRILDGLGSDVANFAALWAAKTTGEPGDIAVATRTEPRAAPPQVSDDGIGPMRSIVFPVLGPVDYYDNWNECRDDCLRHHEGIDIIGVKMQPLLAAVDGTITAIGERGETAGIGVTITARDGWRYNYFHVNNDSPGSDDGLADVVWQTPPGLAVGDRVRAGQIIGYMGNSGNAELSVPHLHFEMRDPAGVPHSPFWALQAAERRQACTIGLGPWSNAASIDPADDREHTTVVTPLFGDGSWSIDSDGRVVAVGDAALVIPSRGLDCRPGPTSPYGTDAAGWSAAR